MEVGPVHVGMGYQMIDSGKSLLTRICVLLY